MEERHGGGGGEEPPCAARMRGKGLGISVGRTERKGVEREHDAKS